MHKHKIILVIVLVVAASSVGTAYAIVLGTNIIFKTSDGITSHEVMRITSDQKVGIGTTMPVSTLDVNGTVGTKGIAVSGTLQGGIANTRIPISNSATTPDSGNVGQYTSITIGSDGLPVVSYYDNNAYPALKILHCGNAACTFGNIATDADLMVGGDVGQYTSIAIGTDGMPVVSYFDVTNSTLKILHCGNVACTSGNTATVVDTGPNVGQYTSIAIGTDGLPVVSYLDGSSGALKIMHCGDAACTSGNSFTEPDAAINVGQFTSTAIGTDGLPVVSYYDFVSDVLKILHCGDTTCTSGNTITQVDGVNVGLFTSITIGTDGLPVVSYANSTGSGSLKVLHCGNVACTSGNIATNVDNSTIGEDTSIAIGTDGMPVVSYFDATNHALKLMHCGNVACNSGNTARIVDSSASIIGEYTSIAIGTDGLPVVSYYDVPDTSLEVFHAGSILGISDWTRR